MVDFVSNADRAWIETTEQQGEVILSVGGDWRAANTGRLFDRLKKLAIAGRDQVRIDLAALELLDTAGAWLVYRTAKRLRADGATVVFANATEDQEILLAEVAANDKPCEIEPPSGNVLLNLLEEIGAGTVALVGGAGRAFSFAGALTQSLFLCLINPFRLRYISLVHHMEQVGLRALPIVGLISFLIGIVIAYLGAQQLRDLGAEIFVVDLLAISILRELGVLITAIVIAGRSGSAFTAQLGTMVLNEEVDALRVLGLDPVELLVLPRVIALFITLPALTFFSDMLGLFGGGVMCWAALDIPPGLYLELLNETMTNWTFWVGMIKAPAFALIIAVTGCYEGLRVSGSAESVGLRTTKSVVVSIFLIIIVNAIFSIFFATLEI
ncbi:MAG: MlaE family lipid ABC transporter permease subunit [Sphingomonadales bacterium]